MVTQDYITSLMATADKLSEGFFSKFETFKSLSIYSFPKNDYALYLSHSETSTFCTCRRKWQFEYRDKIKPRAEKVYFFIGRLLHRAQEFYSFCRFNGFTPSSGAVIASFLVWSNKSLMQLEANTTGLPIAYYSYDQSVRLGVAILTEYFKHWPMPCEVFTLLGAPAIEVGFQVPLQTPSGGISNKFHRVGKADGLIIFAGKLFLRENKFLSSFDASSLKFLSSDPQTASYIYCLQRQYDLKIEGCLYDVCKKSSLRQKKDENSDEFQERIVADYAARPDFYFERHYIFFDSRFVDEIGKSLGEMSKDMSDPYIYPANTFTCMRTNCHFQDICTAPIDAQEDIKKSLYMPKFAKHEELAEEVPF